MKAVVMNNTYNIFLFQLCHHSSLAIRLESNASISDNELLIQSVFNISTTIIIDETSSN